MGSHPIRRHWPVLLVAFIFIFLGIVLWITFPPIYESLVVSNLQLEIHEDKTLPTSTWKWSHPPMTNIMSFYFFNLTNPDEVIYHGAKPAIVEVGPWTFQEKEVKKYMKWSDDGKKVFYENYKTYLPRPDLCNGCRMDDLVTISNPIGLGAAAAIFDPQYNVSSVGRSVVAWSLLLLGEFPFVTQKVEDILFDGYPDPLLSIGHSKFLSLVEVLLGRDVIPIPIPDMPRMGFFQGYNNTQDEWYWVQTGKGDVDRLGVVDTWGDLSSLPDAWWGDDYSRSIRGSDSGSFSKMHLKKDDVLPMFQSFYCRFFDATYLNDTTVHNIPAYTFSVPYEQWDTTSNQNVGFRYRNVEQVNYFPEWPACPNRNQSACVSPNSVDCSRQENLCDDCCQGSFVNGTYLLPPGMYPLVCYPGRLEPSPFSVMYSPPHFVYSPREVIDSVYGLRPSLDQHLPFLYSHEPYSGTVVQVVVQLQVSMPMSASPLVPQLMHLPSSIIPIFWQSARASLDDDTYHLVWLGFVFVPKFIDLLKFCSLLLGGLLLVAVVFRLFRK